MIKFKLKGSFENIEAFFEQNKKKDIRKVLEKYGEIGKQALMEQTPVDTGETKSKWGYIIQQDRESASITWTNDSTNDGVNIVVLLQYGHGTRNGGYVEGIDIVNTALTPVFEEMAQDLFKEVGL